PVSGGGKCASGTGSADGSPVGPTRGGKPSGRSDFDTPVGSRGYAWWYLDAMSDDGQHALVLIAFIGSVFSPYYFRSREAEFTSPYDHCALNVALYGPGFRRWAFTEYRSTAAQFKSDVLDIGRNNLSWGPAGLHCTVYEVGAPLPRPIRG